MLGRALNTNNDIFLQGNSIATVKDGAEVVQHVRSRLLFYLEECAWNTAAGVPYFQRIFKKPANLAEAEALLKTEIIQTSGVKELLDFQLSFNSATRKLSVSFVAETTYGSVERATINLAVRVV